MGSSTGDGAGRGEPSQSVVRPLGGPDAPDEPTLPSVRVPEEIFEFEDEPTQTDLGAPALDAAVDALTTQDVTVDAPTTGARRIEVPDSAIDLYPPDESTARFLVEPRPVTGTRSVERVFKRPSEPVRAPEASGVAETPGWEEQDEKTVNLPRHELARLRAAAASDPDAVFLKGKTERPPPIDPDSLPLPAVLDPDAEG